MHTGEYRHNTPQIAKLGGHYGPSVWLLQKHHLLYVLPQRWSTAERNRRENREREMRGDRRLRGARDRNKNKGAGVQVCPKAKLSLGLEALQLDRGAKHDNGWRALTSLSTAKAFIKMKNVS